MSILKLNLVPKYNQQVIDHLETLLSRAKAGEITELVCVAKLDSGSYENSWTGTDDLMKLAGYLERGKHLMLRRMDGNG